MKKLSLVFSLLLLFQLPAHSTQIEGKETSRRYTMGDLMREEKKKEKPTWQKRTEQLLVTVANIGLFIIHPHIIFGRSKHRGRARAHGGVTRSTTR